MSTPRRTSTPPPHILTPAHAPAPARCRAALLLCCNDAADAERSARWRRMSCGGAAGGEQASLEQVAANGRVLQRESEQASCASMHVHLGINANNIRVCRCGRACGSGCMDHACLERCGGGCEAADARGKARHWPRRALELRRKHAGLQVYVRSKSPRKSRGALLARPTQRRAGSLPAGSQTPRSCKHTPTPTPTRPPTATHLSSARRRVKLGRHGSRSARTQAAGRRTFLVGRRERQTAKEAKDVLEDAMDACRGRRRRTRPRAFD